MPACGTTPPSITAVKQTQAKSVQLRFISSTKRVLIVQNEHHCLCVNVIIVRISVFWDTPPVETYNNFSDDLLLLLLETAHFSEMLVVCLHQIALRHIQ
jgi:hypothetical protein